MVEKCKKWSKNVKNGQIVSKKWSKVFKNVQIFI